MDSRRKSSVLNLLVKLCRTKNWVANDILRIEAMKRLHMFVPELNSILDELKVEGKVKISKCSVFLNQETDAQNITKIYSDLKYLSIPKQDFLKETFGSDRFD